MTIPAVPTPPAKKVHHPACPARHGGLCTQCPAAEKDAAGHEPDIRCAICNDTYIIAAESISARRAALAAWDGCCTPDRPSATNPKGTRNDEHREGTQGLLLHAGEAGQHQRDDAVLEVADRRREGVLPGRTAGLTQTPAGDVGEAPSSAGHHPDDLPATYKRRSKVRPGKSRPSLLSGVPAWVVRRVGVL